MLTYPKNVDYKANTCAMAHVLYIIIYGSKGTPGTPLAGVPPVLTWLGVPGYLSHTTYAVGNYHSITKYDGMFSVCLFTRGSEGIPVSGPRSLLEWGWVVGWGGVGWGYSSLWSQVPSEGVPQSLIPGPFQGVSQSLVPGIFWGRDPGQYCSSPTHPSPEQDRVPNTLTTTPPPPPPGQGQVTPQMVCLLQFSAGGLSCFIFHFVLLQYNRVFCAMHFYQII